MSSYLEKATFQVCLRIFRWGNYPGYLKYNHVYPSKRKAEGDVTIQKRRRQCKEAEAAVMQPQTKDCRQPPKAGRGIKGIFS